MESNHKPEGVPLWTEEYITATTHLGPTLGWNILMVGKFPSKTGHNGAVSIIGALLVAMNRGFVPSGEFVLPGSMLRLGLVDTVLTPAAFRTLEYKQLCIADASGRMPWHPYYDEEWSRRVQQPPIELSKCMRWGCMGEGTMKCSRCQVMLYCSQECSAHGWLKEGHKADCRRGHEVTAPWSVGGVLYDSDEDSSGDSDL